MPVPGCEARRFVIEVPTPPDALRAEDRVAPLVHVAALVEGALRAGRAHVACHGSQIGNDVVTVRCVRRRPRKRTGGQGVRARRVVEVARGQRIVVRRLVPLVLARDEDRGSRIARDRVVRDPLRCDRVGTVLRRRVVLRPRRLAVVQPVREAQRVVEGHAVHRHVLAARDGAVRVAPRTSAPGNTAMGTRCRGSHIEVVEPVGVGGRHRVQELGVLGVGDLVLADLVLVRHRAIAPATGAVSAAGHDLRIYRVPRVTDGDPIDGDRRRQLGANRRLAFADPARLDLAGRVAAVARRCVAVVALLGALDEAIATGGVGDELGAVDPVNHPVPSRREGDQRGGTEDFIGDVVEVVLPVSIADLPAVNLREAESDVLQVREERSIGRGRVHHEEREGRHDLVLVDVRDVDCHGPGQGLDRASIEGPRHEVCA